MVHTEEVRYFSEHSNHFSIIDLIVAMFGAYVHHSNASISNVTVCHSFSPKTIIPSFEQAPAANSDCLSYYFHAVHCSGLGVPINGSAVDIRNPRSLSYPQKFGIATALRTPDFVVLHIGARLLTEIGLTHGVSSSFIIPLASGGLGPAHELEGFVATTEIQMNSAIAAS
jgi:hypothetical protein